MGPNRLRDEDRRRELALWILICADMTGAPPGQAMVTMEEAFVGPIPPRSARDTSPWYQIERMEDYLPEAEEWELHRPRLERAIRYLEEHHEAIDEIIVAASPRWRIDRMPAIDRALLRLGVVEMQYSSRPHPRATINGLIELAKRSGSETTPAFVNGILDQIRRNLGIPFQ